jgi:tRNA nucleotidyltransferase (CCA-adding enzyme)
MNQTVLRAIKPTKKEEQMLRQVTASFITHLNSALEDAKAILGGSGAKGTWLRGGYDIDIFVLFPYKKYCDVSDELSDILDRTIKSLFPRRKRLHGSRDYFQVRYQNYTIEVVPVLNIREARQAKNITDVSPLHVKWVRKLPSIVKDEIRLAKQFTKAAGCYGAESYIGGFSGYVLEVLVGQYRSFEMFVRQAARWEAKTVIDVAGHYRKKSDVFMELNTSKLQSPIIVIDPVDKTRNAAAALSMEKFLLFRKRAQEYLQRPDVSFFEKKKVTLRQLEKETTHNIVYMEVQPVRGKHDVVGGKLLKAFQYLKNHLAEFTLVDSGWEWDGNATFYFIVQKLQIEPFVMREGPPVTMTDAVASFKKKHKETVEKHGKLFAKIPRREYRLEDAVKKLVNDEDVIGRIKRINKMVILS